MAQNVTINGVEYTDVPAVQVPKTSGGIALFLDAEQYRTAEEQDQIDDTIKDSIPETVEAEALSIDTTVTSGSGNLITSGAVYTAVGNVEAALEALL